MNSPKIGLIKLGDLAVELGDLVLAVDCYSKVLNRVNASDGSDLRNKKTIMELKEKLGQLDVKESNAFPFLYAENWKLSKSSFVKGTQCAKYLFLDTLLMSLKMNLRKVIQWSWDKRVNCGGIYLQWIHFF